MSSALASLPAAASAGGVSVADEPAHRSAWSVLDRHLSRLGLAPWVNAERVREPSGDTWRLSLTAQARDAWVPGHDTLGLAQRLAAHWRPAAGPANVRLTQPSSEDAVALPHDDLALEREIAVAMLASPYALHLPGAQEWETCVQVRLHIARAAAKTRLAFQTACAERPETHWLYDEDHGFLVREGVPLIEALRHATQPAVSGRVYDFSCYRATEYVILLGIAEAAAQHNPALLARLQALCERQVIKSRRFHDMFLLEWGSMDEPVPHHHWVPGDRTWFRNPDPKSSDASGYEGSWTMYLGGGLFANFWKDDAPFTLESKSLEIYHWRDAVWIDHEGEERIDEAEVARQVALSQADPQRRAAILERMMRWRDPSGVYAEGGCIDTTREAPRWISAPHESLLWHHAQSL